jgi:hypothetical protein
LKILLKWGLEHVSGVLCEPEKMHLNKKTETVAVCLKKGDLSDIWPLFWKGSDYLKIYGNSSYILSQFQVVRVADMWLYST